MTPPCSPRSGRSTRLFLALSLGIIGAVAPAQAEDVPRGTLNVDRDLVRTGMNSQLDWNIEYPTPDVTDVVDIVPPQRIVPKQKVTMKVRVLGVAFQSGNTLLPLDAYCSINGSSWDRFFYGTGPQVKPGKVVLKKKDIAPGTVIDFGARGWLGNGWGAFHDTTREDQYIQVLKNGDTAPSYAPAYNQGNIISFLKPYMDDRGQVRIGDRDLIILWEASSSRPGSRYFDMQDLVVLVTFE